MGKHVFTKQTVNMTTGEIVEQEIYRKQTDNAEQFTRIFMPDISVLASCSGAEKGVVLACLKYLEYNTNEFIIVPKRRAEIGACASIQPQTISDAISKLLRKNIFIKTGGSSYVLNPNILFYGEEKARKKVVADTLQYKLGGGKGKPTTANKKRKAK